MRSITPDVVFLSARRTPFGTFGGTLKDHSATDLAVIASEAALKDAGVDKNEVDHVIFGNVQQTSADAIYLPRHVGLRTGIPERVPALGVNRLCGSGFQALVNAAEQIMTGQAELVLAGGTESMSQAPHIVRGARWGLQLGKSQLEDSLWTALTDSYTGLPMAITAENLAEKYQISQDLVDAFSIESQQRFAAAQKAGYFDKEITPVVIKSKKGDVSFSKDEHNRPETTLEGLKKLPKVFKKDGVIHAGAASGICDGAAALVMASAEYAKKRGLKPIARMVNWGVAGCDPKIMGIGPVPATQAALRRADAKLGDFSLIEVNEAFAPQALAVIKELELPRDRTNVNGGAIAVGHPLGASGARITTHLIHELARRGQRYGLGSACIGGGQGIAVIVEAL
ncbi:MAG: acetyl-CoA C-acetyltransferase [Deltaproteobacteria bacterium]|nr:acetyl-CoA C-acetyltransferase [Deltaproteobacteria bacterium]